MSEATTVAATTTSSTAAIETKAAAANTAVADQAKPADQAAAATTTEQKQAPAPDKRMAALLKREQSLQKRASELKQQQEQFAQQRAAYEQFEKTKAQAKLNPLAYLESIGLSLDDAVMYKMKGEPTPEMLAKSVKDDLESAKKEWQDERQKLIDQQIAREREQQNAEVEAYYGRVDSFVDAHPDDYELTVRYKAHNMIHRTIEDHYRQNEVVLTEKEAADLVEKYLEDQIQIGLASKKFQAKAQPQPQGDQKRTEGAQQRTLSNQMTASTPAVANRKRTDAERWAAAKAALPDLKPR